MLRAVERVGEFVGRLLEWFWDRVVLGADQEREDY